MYTHTYIHTEHTVCVFNYILYVHIPYSTFYHGYNQQQK